MIINHLARQHELLRLRRVRPGDRARGLGGGLDEKFTLVEVFNDASWQMNGNTNVTDLVRAARRRWKVLRWPVVDATASWTSPVAIPDVRRGRDGRQRQLAPSLVRDRMAAGHATVSGGIYVDAKIGRLVRATR